MKVYKMYDSIYINQNQVKLIYDDIYQSCCYQVGRGRQDGRGRQGLERNIYEVLAEFVVVH